MDDALAHLEVAITLKKDLVDAYALMRRCVQWRSILDPGSAKALKPEQRSALETARSLAPDHPLVILEEALDLFYKPATAGGDQPRALARFREAIARFQQLQKNDPAYMKWWQAMTYMILGRGYLGTEKPEEAERAFQAALALEPNFEMVKSGLLPMTQLVTMPPVRNFQGARWTTLATDAANDGKNPAWPDVNMLSLYDDPEADTLWLKLDLSRFPNPNVFGINLVIDTDENQHNGAHWWGGNNSFKYDKLISVWVVKVGEHAYRGTVGIADVSGIQLNRYTNLFRNNLVFSADGERRTMLLGLKRTEVDDDGNFNMVAAVGSNIAWNDDLPDSGAVEIRSKK